MEGWTKEYATKEKKKDWQTIHHQNSRLLLIKVGASN
jgi:hypothetical protein